MSDEQELNIRYGTIDEYEDSEKNINDIVFLTDIPVIKARGRTYGGNGVPTWGGESKAYSDPTRLFKELYKHLKKTFYMSDTSCPKFDINTYQTWAKVIGTGSNANKVRHGWTTGNILNTYKMRYGQQATEYAHFTNTQKPGSAVVFTFPIKAGSRFFVTPCEETDWCNPDGTHDYMCPGWDNTHNEYKKVYGYANLTESSKEYATEYNGVRGIYDAVGAIVPKVDCTLTLTHRIGETETNNYNESYPKVTLELNPIS